MRQQVSSPRVRFSECSIPGYSSLFTFKLLSPSPSLVDAIAVVTPYQVTILARYAVGKLKTSDGIFRWISPFQPLDVIVKHILTSQLTISSSLHGLVAACSFEVPFRWWWPDFLNSKDSDKGKFKYIDFLESLPNADRASGKTVEDV